jgi:hypothetical protein
MPDDDPTPSNLTLLAITVLVVNAMLVGAMVWVWLRH